jgi:hypothetical protein
MAIVKYSHVLLKLITMLHIKFYSHLAAGKNPTMVEAFQSIDTVVAAVAAVASIYKGKSKYQGDGSETIQFNDVVEFESLIPKDLETILRNYPFARVLIQNS